MRHFVGFKTSPQHQTTDVIAEAQAKVNINRMPIQADRHASGAVPAHIPAAPGVAIRIPFKAAGLRHAQIKMIKNLGSCFEKSVSVP